DEAGAEISSSVRGNDAQDVSAELSGNPTLAENLRAVKRPVEHDADDSVESIGAESFRASHEISGSVVDDGIDFPELLFRSLRRRFDCGIVAHIASAVGGSAAEPQDFFAGFTERLLAPPDEKKPSAQFGKSQSHRPAESRAPARKEDGPAFQHIFLEHVDHLAQTKKVGETTFGQAILMQQRKRVFIFDGNR